MKPPLLCSPPSFPPSIPPPNTPSARACRADDSRLRARIFSSGLPALIFALLLACLACALPGGSGGRALRVGVAPSHPPVIFEQEGEIVGLEADLARGLGARLGRRIVFERFDERELLPALERGDIDVVMSGLSITPERAARVRFCLPYLQVGQLALIRSSDLARFGRIHTIRRPGARVGFVDGTPGEAFVAAELSRATSFGFDGVDSGVRSLRAGRIDYFVHDAPTVWRIAGDPEQRDLHGLYQLLTQEELAWAVRRDDAALKALLDATLEQWQREGSLQPVIDRWIPVRVTIR